MFNRAYMSFIAILIIGLLNFGCDIQTSTPGSNNSQKKINPNKIEINSDDSTEMNSTSNSEVNFNEVKVIEKTSDTNEKTLEIGEEKITSKIEQPPKTSSQSINLNNDIETQKTSEQSSLEITETETLDTQYKSNANAVSDNEIEIKIMEIDHSSFDKILSKYVTDDGQVNYSGLKKIEDQLDEYLKDLADNYLDDQWSRKSKLAYWINAYNAFTIKLILNNFPVKKITDLDNGDPWKVKWIKLGNDTYSLNNIEHDIIRPKFNEPRIHFAVNCAAQSCPPLQNRAYTEDNIETLLNKATETFINNKKYNKVSKSTAQLSKIFEWYAEDFGDLKEYINRYSNIKLGSSASISYVEYDWSLNGE